MLAKPLIKPIINTALIAMCIMLGVYSFGQPVIFDVTSTTAFLIIAYQYRQNIDIKTVCLLLIAEYLIINLAFQTLNSHLLYTAGMFAITAATLWYCRSDKLTLPIAALLIVSLIAHIYWQKIGHPAPQIHWYFFKISLSIIVRQLLMYRPHGLNYYLNSGATILRLDWLVYKTLWVACVIELAMITEFLIRHTTGIKALYLYNSYEYAMHALAVWILWLVLQQAIKIQRKQGMQA